MAGGLKQTGILLRRTFPQNTGIGTRLELGPKGYGEEWLAGSCVWQTKDSTPTLEEALRTGLAREVWKAGWWSSPHWKPLPGRKTSTEGGDRNRTDAHSPG